MSEKYVNVDVYKKGLFMIAENLKECDFCDKQKNCASINWLHGNVICVCEECLKEFIDKFKEE